MDAPDFSFISDILDFFRNQAARHEEDEEASLFPRVKATVGEAVINTLLKQHREHEKLVLELVTEAEKYQSASHKPLASLQRLQTLSGTLARAYADHIQLEDKTLLPATTALSKQVQAEILTEMQARRGR